MPPSRSRSSAKRSSGEGSAIGRQSAGPMSPGKLGELIAVEFLEDHGVTLLARNVRIGRGEVDIVGRAGRSIFVAEVRAVSGATHPLDAIDAAKRRQVASLAARLGVSRCDAIGVGLHHGHAIVHWERHSF